MTIYFIEVFLLFSFSNRRKIYFFLLPPFREVSALGHHRASPSAEDKLSDLQSAIIGSETMNPTSSGDTTVYLTLTSDLSL